MVQFITVFPSLFTQMLFFFNQFTVLFTSYVALLININALKRSDVPLKYRGGNMKQLDHLR